MNGMAAVEYRQLTSTISMQKCNVMLSPIHYSPVQNYRYMPYALHAYALTRLHTAYESAKPLSTTVLYCSAVRAGLISLYKCTN